MLVELVTGERPFSQGAVAAEASLPARYPQLTEAPRLARTLPAGVVAVIEACLQKKPTARPPTAVAVARALDPFTPVKVWPGRLTGAFDPFEPAPRVTRLRRLRS
jgi:hypothetical protein